MKFIITTTFLILISLSCSTTSEKTSTYLRHNIPHEDRDEDNVVVDISSTHMNINNNRSLSSSQNAEEWTYAHNSRRQKFHNQYLKSYVPLTWSNSVSASAQNYAETLISLSGCQIKHGYGGDSYGGENLIMNTGKNPISPENVLVRWVDREEPMAGGSFSFHDSGHFTQVLWRSSLFFGCGTASKDNCHIQVCRYLRPGNCNMNMKNWKEVTFADSCSCGPECPAEGCDTDPTNKYSIAAPVISEQVENITSSCQGNEMRVAWTMTMDKYPKDISWSFTDTSGKLIGTGSRYSVPYKTYSTAWCVAATSCYKFTIQDNYGDGFLSGGYTLQVDDKVVMKYDGSKVDGKGESTQFCGGGSSTTPSSSNPSSPSSSPPNTTTSSSKFKITLMNMGTVTAYDSIFEKAAKTWEKIIIGDLPDVPKKSSSSSTQHSWFGNVWSKKVNVDIDDVLIGYSFESIDGNGKILGYAGPVYSRNDSSSVTAISGTMKFDSADFQQMSSKNAELVILHEMGHVLGIGSFWTKRCGTGCKQGSSAYTCAKAKSEYKALGFTDDLQIEANVCGHWSESNFASSNRDELMTPYFDQGKYQPISRITLGALVDLGYEVDFNVADPWNGSSSTTSQYSMMLDKEGTNNDDDIMMVPTSTFMLNSTNILRPQMLDLEEDD